MHTKSDIRSIDDIRLLVDTFYGAIKTDPMVGPIFIGVIGNRWPEHLQKMYGFWETILLGEHSYAGNPFKPHARMPLYQEHFDSWLTLWHGTIDRFFSGPVADEAKWRAGKMAIVFLSRIEDYRNDPSAIPLI